MHLSVSSSSSSSSIRGASSINDSNTIRRLGRAVRSEPRTFAPSARTSAPEPNPKGLFTAQELN